MLLHLIHSLQVYGCLHVDVFVLCIVYMHTYGKLSMYLTLMLATAQLLKHHNAMRSAAIVDYDGCLEVCFTQFALVYKISHTDTDKCV
jgi:hypothetical protein